MIRRTFLGALAFLPMPENAVTSSPSITTAQHQHLIALIEKLENAPDYQMAAVCWAKAHIAGQIREALGLKVPACQNRKDYLEYDVRESQRERKADGG